MFNIRTNLFYSSYMVLKDLPRFREPEIILIFAFGALLKCKKHKILGCAFCRQGNAARRHTTLN